jgi:haloalkane dehalogenase
MPKPISAEFPFESRYVEVNGHRMHYVEQGSGDPILFLHGNPTSSYLWRNIIPYVSDRGRCIAPDLIGMGKSDKPDLAYRFFDHYAFIEGFIEAMGLKNITLVLHDWGSGLGFHYAHMHPDKIKGIAFMEAIVAPVKWADFPSDFKMGFKLMRTSFIGWLMVSVMNVFVKQILPQATLRHFRPEELAYYAAPFPTIKSRKPVRQWPAEIPIEGRPADVHDAVSGYNRWLQETHLPKLFLYAHPGGLITEKVATWIQEHLPNLTAADIGAGIHYVQEDRPHEIGEALSAWYAGI